jgi:hypothetical protein
MGRGSSYGKKSNWNETLSAARGLVMIKPVASLRTQIRHNAVRNAVRPQEESIVVELEEQIQEQIQEQIEEPVLPPIEEPVVLVSEEASFFGSRCNHAHTVQNTFCH